MSEPILYLKAEEALEVQKLPEKDPASPLLKDLEGVTGLCRRASRRVSEGVLGEIGDRGRRGLSRAWAGARLAFEGLMEKFEEDECSTKTRE